MLISENQKFLFVHIQKTAGTSLTQHFHSEIADISQLLRPHDPLSFAELKANIHIDSYFKVGFVRNPFDRLVSWYSMIVENGQKLSEKEKLLNPAYNKIWQYVLSNSSCFDEFILNCSEAQDRSGWRPFSNNQIEYLKDKNDNVAGDFIGRFESISADVTKLCKVLNIASDKFPHINKSTHNNYRKYYTSETRSLIERRFETDLNYFNYNF